MKLFNKDRAPSVYKYEGDNKELLKKINLTNFSPDAVIKVPETHCAILLKDGKALSVLDSGSHPVFDYKTSIFGNSKKIDPSVDIDCLFISLTHKMELKWGTPSRFDYRDSVTGIAFTVGANGIFEVRIKEPKKAYLELIGSPKEFTDDELAVRLLERMVSKINPVLAKTMSDKKITYEMITMHLGEIEDAIYPVLKTLFIEDYGLELTAFTINVSIKDTDKQRIEAELLRIKEENKKEEQEAKDEMDAKEYAREIERLDDKNFNRMIILTKLKDSNYEKYLEVCKIIGWEAEPKKPSAPIQQNQNEKRCWKCGTLNPQGGSFCCNCGENLNGKKCPECNSINLVTNKFCSICGKKL